MVGCMVVFIDICWSVDECKECFFISDVDFVIILVFFKNKLIDSKIFVVLLDYCMEDIFEVFVVFLFIINLEYFFYMGFMLGLIGKLKVFM